MIARPLRLCAYLSLALPGALQADPVATITIDPGQRLGRIEPMLHGQFIEHLGTCIKGGVFEPGSPLADEHGFRKDVIDKTRELDPRLLRWPGGTYTKIYHWQDGIGPKEERRKRPNLIWGGIEDHLFGTNEFILYCRKTGAEPYISVNMATGSAEEASNWVEYCNGTGDTHYANLRRKHGFEKPHAVKFWGLGNEEEAEPDAGILQDPETYAGTAWHFAKLMKLQDPSIKLIVAGVGSNMEWNRTVLSSLHPVADYLSAHWYFKTTEYGGLLERVAAFDRQMTSYKEFLGTFPPKPEFSHWYRFPPRQGPVRLAIDEWGLWNSSGTAKDTWGLYQTYTWQDALGVASWLNAMRRHSSIIGFANWAQLANIIAPIRTDRDGSVRQTIFHPLALYSNQCGRWSVAARCESPALDAKGLPALDVSAGTSGTNGDLTLFVVNRHPSLAIATRIEPGNTGLRMNGGIELTSSSMDASNSLDRKDIECVRKRELPASPAGAVITFPAASVTALFFSANP